MRAVAQRVNGASVSVNGDVAGEIGLGLMVLLGVGPEDNEQDAVYLAKKMVNLRIFPDAEEKMNLSLLDVGGAVLSVSQFTLYGDCRKGRRPSFAGAALPTQGEKLYHVFNECLQQFGINVAVGRFGAHMEVKLTNDGPVTLLLDSKKNF
ncbi:D-tyrosyl-tRNA(Tyr) deacylase [Metallumcola ferriviriculae]|uniref:D-aminoacyl-tRNA deacylase n=1 Tax=Metallumcola ferriviriculae TaxID=3039180 RepID=A0AAU0UQY2_9FIRM|nr:D-tyrosyl-tRNA(Tyr) deacylase [Desulfitibacteraceae bacterium MK1]